MNGSLVTLRQPAEALWPAPLDQAALHGVIGELVRAIEPHSESDPVAILAQSLIVFGSMLGRCGCYQVEATHHHTNEFAVLVGESSRARKGSAFDQVLGVLSTVDRTWAERRIASGLASGEGLVWRVRDADDAEDADPQDKRLMAVEPEFAAVLKITRRQDNTLSAILRNAWDGRTLENLSKTAPARATGAHISIIGHITRDELQRNVDASEVANGLLNRFMHFAVRSSKMLPFGGEIDQVDFNPVTQQLRLALRFGQVTERVRFGADAREIWPEHYARLRDGHPGLWGDVTARAEAHVVRLALIYALLDCSDTIDAEHLGAALAVWEYSDQSARWCYGHSIGDPLADELWHAISHRPEGMTRTAIRDHFSRNKRRHDIDNALTLLVHAQMVSVAAAQAATDPRSRLGIRLDERTLPHPTPLRARAPVRRSPPCGSSRTCVHLLYTSVSASYNRQRGWGRPQHPASHGGNQCSGEMLRYRPARARAQDPL